MSTKRIPSTSSTPWSPRADISAVCAQGPDGGFTVGSNGSPGCYGGWELTYPAPRSPFVRVRVKARLRDVQRGGDSVHAALVWLPGKGQPFAWEPLTVERVSTSGILTLGCVARRPERVLGFSVRLLLAWSDAGEIEWSKPEVEECGPPRPRKWRLGAAGGPLPPGRRSFKTNTDAYLGLCRQAAAQNVDLLCLPEVMLSTGLPSSPDALAQQAIAIPGRETAPFQTFCQESGVSLCFSAWERAEGLVHNTAVLIAKSGEIAGTYRKVHLASPLEVWWGVTPGHEFPVYRLGNARVAMNICMDSSVAESARVPAMVGAEVLCMPIMGDNRAVRGWEGVPSDFDIERWTAIQRVRAMDNQLYMVISRNTGYGSGVFSPRGEVLALSGGRQVVHADVDLADLPRTWTGAAFRGVAHWVRREPAYGPLVEGLRSEQGGYGR